MSDVFKVIADQNARLTLEALADAPGSKAKDLEASTSLKTEVVAKHLAAFLEVGIIKSTGSGASKKYSLNAKGFGPYVSWLAKVAERQAVASLEIQLVDIAEKVGQAFADGGDWVNQKISENVDVDTKKWGRELGRKIAEIKVEVQSEAKELKRSAEKLAQDTKNEAVKLADEVKSNLKL
jgi:DNA-binding transcriptional ArsR family regulator